MVLDHSLLTFEKGDHHLQYALNGDEARWMIDRLGMSETEGGQTDEVGRRRHRRQAENVAEKQT